MTTSGEEERTNALRSLLGLKLQKEAVEEQTNLAIERARDLRITRDEIASVLGVKKQTAWEKYRRYSKGRSQ